MRAHFAIGAFGLAVLGVSVAGQQTRHLNPMVDLLSAKKAVYGLGLPTAGGRGGGGNRGGQGAPTAGGTGAAGTTATPSDRDASARDASAADEDAARACERSARASGR